ncbi:T9SS type B sorting domain-containing protein [Tenacibaculum sp.]|uniref:T9SS type B sorting domain-containing protein n=1 Tax=Tenacibaculum sp. TaxID=1906242 RepID=UPI003D0FAD9E
MKNIFSLLFIISYSFSYSQNTYVPDDNFEQFLIDLGYDSGPLNDYVPTNNISTVTDLSISGNATYIWEIKSLQGIEDFIALEKLTIELNEVVTIDLSSNTNLRELYIYSDSLLENLNITNNNQLEKFHCIVTSIDSINLSNNINIRDLTIGNSSITELDLTNNTKIEKLNLSHGILEKVNFKNGNNSSITQFSCIGNSNLTCFQIDNENYSKTNWIDIDNNSVFSETCFSPRLTYVPDDNFEQELINLGYDSGPLDDYVLTSNIETIKKLDIENKNISDMTGIQDFVSLTYLDCSDNFFTNIDVSQLIKIETLICGAGNLNTLNIKNNTLIKFLSVNDSKLSSINVTKNINLEHFVIYGNNLSVLDISNNLKLRFLSCSSNNLTQLNTSNNPDLYWLDIYFNKISSLDLSNNLKLARLDCFNNSIKELNLINNKGLTFLNCRYNQLTNVDIRNNNNTNILSNSFDLRYNPNLTCVLVDNINYSTTNWTQIDNNTVFKEDINECNQTTCTITVNTLNDVITCDNYPLPNLSNSKYYTQSGGNGNQLNSGDIITLSQTIFIYNEDPTNPSCFDESSFHITINNSPDVDILNDVIAINKFTLPNLTNGNYYTESGGNGNQLNSGDIITTSQIVYIYNVNPINPRCYNESSFKITIEEERDIIIPNFFTPNNDGNNDTWIIKDNNNLIKEIYIMDRFGKIVSKIKPNSVGWNGLYNSKPLPSTTYWYQIIFTNGKTKNGAFALIRN